MSEHEGCYLALAMLWFGAAIAFVMKWYGYQLTADLSMATILGCFTMLTILHHIPSPPIFSSAAAAEAPALPASREMPADHVTRPGDGFYHTPYCERLIGSPTIQYDAHRSDRAPCVDCVLPQIHRIAPAGDVEVARSHSSVR